MVCGGRSGADAVCRVAQGLPSALHLRRKHLAASPFFLCAMSQTTVPRVGSPSAPPASTLPPAATQTALTSAAATTPSTAAVSPVPTATATATTATATSSSSEAPPSSASTTVRIALSVALDLEKGASEGAPSLRTLSVGAREEEAGPAGAGGTWACENACMP